MAHHIERQAPHRRIGEIKRIATAGIVDEVAIGGMRISGVVQPAQRNHAAIAIAFAGMVEYQVKQHADAILVKRGHGLA